ncbi:MAG: preprotein translocase subunit SecE [Bacteroidaceae bacterium]|nr:preprotein translocase subunit SecE [Bacteroidaceae bacterium]
MFKKFIKYCKDSYEELTHKTTWPTRSELTHSSVVVLTASIIIAIVVFAMDEVFRFVMTTVYPHY